MLIFALWFLGAVMVVGLWSFLALLAPVLGSLLLKADDSHRHRALAA